MKKQDKLFNDPAPWEIEWQDMPEYIQEKKTPYKQIVVRFDTEEDYHEFAKLIGQNLTDKTKSIWHPKLKRRKGPKVGYVNES